VHWNKSASYACAGQAFRSHSFINFRMTVNTFFDWPGEKFGFYPPQPGWFANK
jgi:hypothetical protein